MNVVNFLTRRWEIDLKYNNFIVFILYFCEFYLHLLVDCMFNCHICAALSRRELRMFSLFRYIVKQPNAWETFL